MCSIRPSVDGLYRDGTVHISREMHKQCFITRREMTSLGHLVDGGELAGQLGRPQLAHPHRQDIMSNSGLSDTSAYRTASVRESLFASRARSAPQPKPHRHRSRTFL